MKVSGNQTKIHYKGTKTDEDFIVFVDSDEDLKKWKGDKSTPLAQVVGLFKVFVTHKHGAQGSLDEASVSQLENEFGTKVDDEVIKVILEKGEAQHGPAMEKTGPKNDSMGAMAAH
ncbi:10d618a7-1d8d-469b-9d6f-48f89ab482b3 [Sclerotinia trifoliorum]|uniref:10d618a7-1d8d-469b-9d6f-48f89ab482b3 n=1 Tax=Sclerotinia trifoliorum TaxID=28548 RepID=A0A8H2W102_9HELO|nr:10d618a7-1d8d-469b-9d6f-48f89ab482b3 [Sclerotinia trifoliorum]